MDSQSRKLRRVADLLKSAQDQKDPASLSRMVKALDSWIDSDKAIPGFSTQIQTYFYDMLQIVTSFAQYSREVHSSKARRGPSVSSADLKAVKTIVQAFFDFCPNQVKSLDVRGDLTRLFSNVLSLVHKEKIRIEFWPLFLRFLQIHQNDMETLSLLQDILVGGTALANEFNGPFWTIFLNWVFDANMTRNEAERRELFIGRWELFINEVLTRAFPLTCVLSGYGAPTSSRSRHMALSHSIPILKLLCNCILPSLSEAVTRAIDEASEEAQRLFSAAETGPISDGIAQPRNSTAAIQLDGPPKQFTPQSDENGPPLTICTAYLSAICHDFLGMNSPAYRCTVGDKAPTVARDNLYSSYNCFRILSFCLNITTLACYHLPLGSFEWNGATYILRRFAILSGQTLLLAALSSAEQRVVIDHPDGTREERVPRAAPLYVSTVERQPQYVITQARQQAEKELSEEETCDWLMGIPAEALKQAGFLEEPITVKKSFILLLSKSVSASQLASTVPDHTATAQDFFVNPIDKGDQESHPLIIIADLFSLTRTFQGALALLLIPFVLCLTDADSIEARSPTSSDSGITVEQRTRYATAACHASINLMGNMLSLRASVPGLVATSTVVRTLSHCVAALLTQTERPGARSCQLPSYLARGAAVRAFEGAVRSNSLHPLLWEPLRSLYSTRAGTYTLSQIWSSAAICLTRFILDAEDGKYQIGDTCRNYIGVCPHISVRNYTDPDAVDTAISPWLRAELMGYKQLCAKIDIDSYNQITSSQFGGLATISEEPPWLGLVGSIHDENTVKPEDQQREVTSAVERGAVFTGGVITNPKASQHPSLLVSQRVKCTSAPCELLARDFALAYASKEWMYSLWSHVLPFCHISGQSQVPRETERPALTTNYTVMTEALISDIMVGVTGMTPQLLYDHNGLMGSYLFRVFELLVQNPQDTNLRNYTVAITTAIAAVARSTKHVSTVKDLGDSFGFLVRDIPALLEIRTVCEASGAILLSFGQSLFSGVLGRLAPAWAEKIAAAGSAVLRASVGQISMLTQIRAVNAVGRALGMLVTSSDSGISEGNSDFRLLCEVAVDVTRPARLRTAAVRALTSILTLLVSHLVGKEQDKSCPRQPQQISPCSTPRRRFLSDPQSTLLSSTSSPEPLQSSGVSDAVTVGTFEQAPFVFTDPTSVAPSLPHSQAYDCMVAIASSPMVRACINTLCDTLFVSTEDRFLCGRYFDLKAGRDTIDADPVAAALNGLVALAQDPRLTMAINTQQHPIECGVDAIDNLFREAETQSPGSYVAYSLQQAITRILFCDFFTTKSSESTRQRATVTVEHARLMVRMMDCLTDWVCQLEGAGIPLFHAWSVAAMQEATPFADAFDRGQTVEQMKRPRSIQCLIYLILNTQFAGVPQRFRTSDGKAIAPLYEALQHSASAFMTRLFASYGARAAGLGHLTNIFPLWSSLGSADDEDQKQADIDSIMYVPQDTETRAPVRKSLTLQLADSTLATFSELADSEGTVRIVIRAPGGKFIYHALPEPGPLPASLPFRADSETELITRVRGPKTVGPGVSITLNDETELVGGMGSYLEMVQADYDPLDAVIKEEMRLTPAYTMAVELSGASPRPTDEPLAVAPSIFMAKEDDIAAKMLQRFQEQLIAPTEMEFQSVAGASHSGLPKEYTSSVQQLHQLPGTQPMEAVFDPDLLQVITADVDMLQEQYRAEIDPALSVAPVIAPLPDQPCCPDSSYGLLPRVRRLISQLGIIDFSLLANNTNKWTAHALHHTPELEEQLKTIDELPIAHRHVVPVFYAPFGSSWSFESIFTNTVASAEFERVCELLGWDTAVGVHQAAASLGLDPEGMSLGPYIRYWCGGSHEVFWFVEPQIPTAIDSNGQLVSIDEQPKVAVAASATTAIIWFESIYDVDQMLVALNSQEETLGVRAALQHLPDLQIIIAVCPVDGLDQLYSVRPIFVTEALCDTLAGLPFDTVIVPDLLVAEIARNYSLAIDTAIKHGYQGGS